MKFVLMTVASAREPWADEAFDLYKKKISFFCNFEHLALKPKKSSRTEAAFKKAEESQLILENLSTDDYVLLLDERGKSLDSILFAKKIEAIMMTGKKRAVFIIGGAFGVDDSVRKRADFVMSFSPMVFNHLLAQTMCLEQIYRGFTIIKNIPYHNI